MLSIIVLCDSGPAWKDDAASGRASVTASAITGGDGSVADFDGTETRRDDDDDREKTGESRTPDEDGGSDGDTEYSFQTFPSSHGNKSSWFS